MDVSPTRGVGLWRRVRGYAAAEYASEAGDRQMATRSDGHAQRFLHGHQLAPMLDGEPQQDFLALGGEADKHLAAVDRAGLTPDHRLGLRTIDEPHHAVLAHLEPLRQLRDCGAIASGIPLDGEQQLMLLGGDVFASGGLLAETQELANRVAKRGDHLKIRLGHGIAGVDARRGLGCVLVHSAPTLATTAQFDLARRHRGDSIALQ